MINEERCRAKKNNYLKLRTLSIILKKLKIVKFPLYFFRSQSFESFNESCLLSKRFVTITEILLEFKNVKNI